MSSWLSKFADKRGTLYTPPRKDTSDERPTPFPLDTAGSYVSAYADQLDQELEKTKPGFQITRPEDVMTGRDIRYVRLLAENGDEIATVPINNMRIERSMGAEVRIELQLVLRMA